MDSQKPSNSPPVTNAKPPPRATAPIVLKALTPPPRATSPVILRATTPILKATTPFPGATAPLFFGNMADRPRLDARAAELKEKLLRSRSTRTPNNNHSLTPASIRPPPLQTGLPQPPIPPFEDEGEDIADLIKSISAQSPPGPPITTNDKQTINQTVKQPVKSVPATAPVSSINASSQPAPISPAQPVPGLGPQTKTPVVNRPIKTNLSPEGEVMKDVSVKREQPSPTEKATPLPVYQPKQTAPSSVPKNIREKEKSQFTPTKQPVVVPEYRGGGQSGPASTSVAGVTAREGGRNQESISDTNARKASSSTNGNSLNTSNHIQGAENALTRLLERDADLRDWLIMTNYHDIELRNRKLERHRKAAALAAEKERIEVEQRKLMEEDELDRMQGIAPTSVTPVPNSTLFAAPTKRTNSSKDGNQLVPAKRSTLEQYRRRPEPQPYSHRRTPSREPSPARKRPRQYSPRPPDYRGPPHNMRRRRSDFSEHADQDRERRHDSGYDDRHREVDLDGPPIDIDLGRKGDTRFFIVKSFNEQNVQRCMEDGVWATQVHNVQTLTKAFADCKHVILFFSVNRSKAFQGYARMATTPSPDTPHPRWIHNINWETSHPFRVQWLSKIEVQFYHIGHIKNPYNEGNAVLVGKDGQEVEEECGRRLLKDMFAIGEAKYQSKYGPVRKHDRRDERNGRRDDRDERDDDGRPRYVKREGGEVFDYVERDRR
ncbi:YT521-B-like domain-containing protein [Immersiella caudata]|uniref:YT521-B-like domain-containing protein n=1 Tax=Immersiella caudata TaxID=314043 RepID=A0AA39WKW1_9PEZI|nr:YT521-B-like domain-containing protein [Immersiella caudata]